MGRSTPDPREGDSSVSVINEDVKAWINYRLVGCCLIESQYRNVLILAFMKPGHNPAFEA